MLYQNMQIFTESTPSPIQSISCYVRGAAAKMLCPIEYIFWNSDHFHLQKVLGQNDRLQNDSLHTSDERFSVFAILAKKW